MRKLKVREFSKFLRSHGVWNLTQTQVMYPGGLHKSNSLVVVGSEVKSRSPVCWWSVFSTCPVVDSFRAGYYPSDTQLLVFTSLCNPLLWPLAFLLMNITTVMGCHFQDCDSHLLARFLTGSSCLCALMMWAIMLRAPYKEPTWQGTQDSL